MPHSCSAAPDEKDGEGEDAVREVACTVHERVGLFDAVAEVRPDVHHAYHVSKDAAGLIVDSRREGPLLMLRAAEAEARGAEAHSSR